MATTDEKLNNMSLLGETVGCVVLDSGTTSTVGGLAWFECFIETLSDDLKKKMVIRPGSRSFKFGTGQKLPSLKSVTLPCVMGGVRVDINADIVDAEIPLLLSKAAMKKAGTSLDFKNDVIWIFGRKMKLETTSSGHYYVPITKPMKMDYENYLVLFLENIEEKTYDEKFKIAKKLHWQFSHPSGTKLCNLVKNSGKNDREFLKILGEFPSFCDFCQRYKRAEPRPIVGFSLATEFNETVAMDLKDIKEHKILHLIDLATKYSVAVKIPNKESITIIKAIFKYWIAYFGAPKNFLSDNGREFDNQDFRDMCQNLNVIVRTTAAQSPWSNGVVERHNGILGESVLKTLESTQCSFEIALSWAVSAKNTLPNIHGYSPNQMVFGKNPNLPSILVDKPPALEGVSSSDIVADNLNAMRNARKAYVECESSEKLRRALRHQIRPANAQKYKNGDLVYYKRNESVRWMGPGIVIGWEAKQILVKHGGTYVRVHPCRLMHVTNPDKYYDIETSDTELDKNDSKDGRKIISEKIVHEPDVDEFEDFSEPQEELQKDQNKKTPEAPMQKSLKLSDLPKPGQKIDCTLLNNEEYKNLKIISRAGKATGSNKYFLNVVQEDTARPFCLDFENKVSSWEVSKESENEEEVSESFLLSPSDPLVISARRSELSSWEKNKVYTVVPDVGQSKITTRWIDNEKKSRLVARGFQEKNVTVRTDSPTCSKEGLKVALAIIVSNGWSCNSLDVKTAFLQGDKIDRPVYLLPPPEAKCEKGKLWKLKKCVYGLNDAARSWYLTVKKELIKLGAEMSKLDQAVFTWYYEGKLHGIISTHVDDFCWGGSKIFRQSVIENIKTTFVIKSEEINKFKYVGLEIEQKEEEIIISQDKYVEALEMTPYFVSSERMNRLSPKDETTVRQVNGKLNWIATQTRPDLSFDVSEFSLFMKRGKVECFKQANKNIKKAKREKSQICIPNLGNLDKLSIVAYSDASFANLEDGGSQGGYIIFVVGDKGNYFPLHWQSRRVRRVVKSTQAAETLAMVDMAEACIFYRTFICELLHIENLSKIPVVCKTDNSGMYECVHSSTQALDKRLRIEISILREMLRKKEIDEITWIPTNCQIADSLTKRGVPSYKILNKVSGHDGFTHLKENGEELLTNTLSHFR